MTAPRILRSICTITFLFILALLSSANGQSDLGKQILDAFNKGDYENTVTLSEKYLKDNPGAEDTGSALYFSGLGHFLLKQYPVAVIRLQGAADFADAPADIKEAALYDLGRALIAYSENLTPEMLKTDQDFRKANFPDQNPDTKKAPPQKGKTTPPQKEDPYITAIMSGTADNIKNVKNAILDKALETYDRLLTTYKNSLFIPDAMQSKGFIYIQRGDLEQAEKTFEALATLPAAASMKDDIEFRLGWIYGQRAGKLAADYEKDKADQYIAKARAIYERLSTSDNLATANDSIFQLATLDLTDGKFDSAIQRFHSVMPKAAVIAAQKERISLLTAQLVALPKDAGDKKKLMQRDLQHEQDRLQKIESGSDLSVDALVCIGNAYLQNKKADEARTVYRYALGFAENDPNQKKGILIQIIISYALQGVAGEAEKLFNDFKTKYPNDPMAEGINYYIGHALMQQARDTQTGTIDKDKIQQAIDHFKDNLKDFPGSRLAPEIIKSIGECYQMLGQPGEAVKVYEKFIDDVKSNTVKVAPDAFEDTQRLMALALFNLNKKEEALKMMADLRASAKTPEIQEFAYYTYGIFLQKMDKKEEAAKAIDEFVSKFPNSPNAPNAFYSRAQILFGLSKGDPAKIEASAQAFRDVYTKFPNDKVAERAYDAVWKVYRDAKMTDKMVEAQDLFLKKFPYDPSSIDIYVSRARDILSGPDSHPDNEKARIAIEDKAIAAYGDALSVYTKAKAAGETITPELEERAASSQLAVGDIYQRREDAMGAYKSMTDDDKKTWNETSDKALEAYKNAVRIAPATKISSAALTKMIDVIKAMISFQKIDMDGGLNIFIKLATEPDIIQNPAAKNQVLIGSASLPYDLGMKDRARQIYEDAFKNLDPSVPVQWEDLDRYASILVELKKYDDAEKIYDRLKTEFGKYKARDGTEKDNPYVLASYTYGKAVCAANLGRTDEANQYFDTLEKSYKWSSKYVESMLFRADLLFKAKKVDDAIKLLIEATDFPNAGRDVHARALFQIGDILQQLGDSYHGPILKLPNGKLRIGPDDKPLTATGMAYNYYNQVDLLYGDALPELTAQGLIRAADIDIQRGRKDQAKKILNKIINRYSTTSSLNKARDMLATLQ